MLASLLSACRAFAALTSPPTLGRALPECPTESKLKSEGSQPVQWSIHNSLRVSVQLFWVSFEGSEVKMEKLGPGDRTTVSTYGGHAWRIRSAQGGPSPRRSSTQPLEPSCAAPCMGECQQPSHLATPQPQSSLNCMLAGRREASRLLCRGDVGDGSHAEPICWLPACLMRRDGTPDALAAFAEGSWNAHPSALIPWGVATDLSELPLRFSMPESAEACGTPAVASLFHGGRPQAASLSSLRPRRARCFSRADSGYGRPSHRTTWRVFANGHSAVGAQGRKRSVTDARARRGADPAHDLTAPCCIRGWHFVR